MSRPGPIESIVRLAGAAAMLGASPAAAQGSSPRWGVDGGQVYCTLSRTGDPQVPSFAIRMIPDIHLQGELVIWSTDWASSPLQQGDSVTVRIDPEGHEFEAEANTGRLPSGARAVSVRLDFGFIHRFRSARAVRVRRGSTNVIDLTFPSAERVFEVMRDCIDRTRERWGMDLAEIRRVRTPPHLVDDLWIDDGDYPRSAIRNDESGLVLARIHIDQAGRVTACRVIRSSGSGALDRRTCETALANGRYHPARDADGEPIALDIVVPVRFRIRG